MRGLTAEMMDDSIRQREHWVDEKERVDIRQPKNYLVMLPFHLVKVL